jgi:hypothetical protein
MLPSVPLPTDNLYKFVCFFGLAMFVVGVFGFISITNSEFDHMTRFVDDMTAAEAKQDRARAEELMKRFERLNEVQRIPKAVAMLIVILSINVGVFMSFMGFLFWAKKKQKQDDRLLELQIAKLEAEIENLRRPINQT